MQVDQIKLSGIVERYIVFETSGSIKNAPKRAPKWVEDVNKMAAARVLHKLVNWLILDSIASFTAPAPVREGQGAWPP